MRLFQARQGSADGLVVLLQTTQQSLVDIMPCERNACVVVRQYIRCAYRFARNRARREQQSSGERLEFMLGHVSEKSQKKFRKKLIQKNLSASIYAIINYLG